MTMLAAPRVDARRAELLERRCWAAAFAAYLAFGAAFQAFPPFFADLHRSLGLTRTTTGLVMTLFLVPAILLARPLGGVVDRRGAVPLAEAGFAVLLLGGAAGALAPGYAGLLVARAAAGAGAAAVLVATLKLIGCFARPGRLGSAFGVFVAGLPTGTAVAFDAVAPVTRGSGWHAAAAASEIVVAGCLGVFWWATRPLRGAARDPRAPAPRPGSGSRAHLGRLLALVALGYAAIIAFTTWAPTRIADYAHVAPQTATIIASVLLVVDIPFAPLWGRLSDRLGRRKPFVVASFAVYGAGAVMLPFVARAGGPRAVWLLTVVAAMGIGCAMFFPVALALVPAFVDPAELGRGFGSVLTAQVTGMALGPLALGAVFAHATTPVGIWTIAALSGAGLLAGLSLRAD